jgi:Ni,Fe-hydrogenase III large subunit/Ni,Fe-hydrogenase III component G
MILSAALRRLSARKISMNDSELLHRYIPGRSAVRRGNTLAVSVDAAELAAVFRTLAGELPFMTMFATDESCGTSDVPHVFRVHYVFGVPHESVFIVPVIAVSEKSFPSLAREFPFVALHERLIMTMFGLTAEGHPDPRSLILHEENWPLDTHPMRKDFKWDTRVPVKKDSGYPYASVEGVGIYEIPVGPVHAGIIEPGHFRFSVAGEQILGLEARLGWVHKGVEKLFENLPREKHLQLSEHISGDSSFSHSLAYCEAIEALTGTAVPARARFLRLIFAELERITMHAFDIGNIGGNGTGFTFMAAHGFRMTEELRQISESQTGSRFLRGVNAPGGVAKDITPEDAAVLLKFLSALKKDFSGMMRAAGASASLANRLQGTGRLAREIARESRAVGIAARACNIPKDARIEYPYAAYKELQPAIAVEAAGDVDARFKVRVKEVYESMRLIEQALKNLPAGALAVALRPIPEDGIAVSAVEGWRGEIVYAIQSKNAAITRVAVRDPSFIHWQLFPHLVTSDMVPDFPLINKSLNLSYTGNDL